MYIIWINENKNQKPDSKMYTMITLRASNEYTTPQIPKSVKL